MLLLPHLCRHSDLSLGTLLHLGNFNWPHLEILFSSPVRRSQILLKKKRNFKGNKILKRREERMREKDEIWLSFSLWNVYCFLILQDYRKIQGLAQTQKDSDVILKWEVGWWRILYH